MYVRVFSSLPTGDQGEYTLSYNNKETLCDILRAAVNGRWPRRGTRAPPTPRRVAPSRYTRILHAALRSDIKPLHPGTSPTTVQRTSKIYVGIALDAMPYVLGPPDESDLVVQRHLRLEEIVDATDAPFRFLLRWRRGGLLQLSGHVTLRKRLV